MSLYIYIYICIYIQPTSGVGVVTFELYLVLMLRYHGKKQGKKNTEERENAKRFFSSFSFKKKGG